MTSQELSPSYEEYVEMCLFLEVTQEINQEQYEAMVEISQQTQELNKEELGELVKEQVAKVLKSLGLAEGGTLEELRAIPDDVFNTRMSNYINSDPNTSALIHLMDVILRYREAKEDSIA
jgi:hypothetical protein